jgi:hypothetical protein
MGSGRRIATLASTSSRFRNLVSLLPSPSPVVTRVGQPRFLDAKVGFVEDLLGPLRHPEDSGIGNPSRFLVLGFETRNPFAEDLAEA